MHRYNDLFCKILFLLFLLAKVTALSAQTIETVDRNVFSNGTTRQGAIINAVIEAIRQVHGAEVDALQRTRSSLQEVIIGEGNESTLKSDYEFESLEDITMHTNGLVESYEVLEWNHISVTNEWEVKLKVNLPVYVENYSNSDKSTVAIMPFRVQNQFDRLHDVYPIQVANMIASHINSNITTSEHFRVLDRDYNNEFLAERNQLIHGNVAVRELARLGQQLGADYLIVGEILDLILETRIEQFYDAKVEIHQVSLSISARVIEFATRRVCWSGTLTFELEPREIRERIGPTGNVKQLLPNLSDIAASSISGKLLDAAFPIMVLDIPDEDTIYLNQGSPRLSPGDDLVIPGAERVIQDPQTGNSITVNDKDLAIIRVVEVRDNYSIADVLEGNVKDVEKGQACARL